jgi:hypothetical protein
VYYTWLSFDRAFVLASDEAFAAVGSELAAKADYAGWPIPSDAALVARRRAALEQALAAAWALRRARVNLEDAARAYRLEARR